MDLQPVACQVFVMWPAASFVDYVDAVKNLQQFMWLSIPHILF